MTDKRKESAEYIAMRDLALNQLRSGKSLTGAIIRPDCPELKEWPYFWQQTEYVMGGGATNFMFLVLAADNLLKK